MNASLHRRSFLRAGTLAVGGLTYAPFFNSTASASGGKSPLTGKTVIFLFMQGGPTQFETFDPKPDAAEGIRTVGGVTQTTIPGVTFGSTFKHLAEHANKLAIVRNFVTGTQHGGLKPIVSELTHGASLGALYSRVAGTTDPKTGLPTAACLHPSAVDPKEDRPRNRFGNFDVTGPIGAGYAPFTPGSKGVFQENLKLQVTPERLDDRQTLLKTIDKLKREVDADAFDSIDGQRQQAAAMLLKGVSQTFDISRENKKTLERYDTKHFLDPKQWDKRKNGPLYATNINTLGKLLLLSRRLAEAGTGFITINTEFVWDFHGDGNNVGIEPGMKAVGAPFDHAVSAFIEDIEARGLSDKILLVCCGEMGRTPKINKNGGRDHWPSLAPLMLYGGGLSRGQVVGKSTADGGKPVGTPTEPKHLLTTIVNTLIDVNTARVLPGLPRDVIQMLADTEKVAGVI